MRLAPMLATAAAALPEGPEWTYEVKWDGYRALAVKTGSRVELVSRNGKDLARDYPMIVAAIGDLKTSDVVVDGEIVALDGDGRPSFQSLQHRRTSGLALVYYTFDLLQVEHESLLHSSLEQRRRRLKHLVAGSGVLVSEPLPGSPAHIEREIRKLRLEGVVAKRLDSPYLPGQRSAAWLKVKFSPSQEFVIGGYTPSAANFDAVLVGYYDDQQRLYFASKVRAGFTPHLRAEVIRRIADRRARRCPFANLPNSTGKSRWGEGITDDDMRAIRWVRPAVVVEVAFVEWTADGLLRHAQFVALRDDKPARDVRRET